MEQFKQIALSWFRAAAAAAIALYLAGETDLKTLGMAAVAGAAGPVAPVAPVAPAGPVGPVGPATPCGP